MFLPLSDSPNPKGAAWVTWALLAANVLVFALLTVPLAVTPADPTDPLFPAYRDLLRGLLRDARQFEAQMAAVSAYDLFVFRWGFRSNDPSVSTLFTSIFLHGGFLHLFGNMLFLWIYGDNVEHRLGRGRFLLAYLGTGVAATLVHVLLAGVSPTPLVGASGAISGVLGFYLRWFPRNQVRLLVFLFPLLARVILLPARVVLLFYLVLDNLLPLLLAGGGSGTGVAFGAHLGGFVAGYVVALTMDRRAMAAPAEDLGVAPLPADGHDAATIREALRSGQFEVAARLFLDLGARESRGLLTAEELLAIARWLDDEGHPRSAQTACARLLRDHPTGPAAAEAHVRLGELQLTVFGQPTAAWQHFLDALDLGPPAEVADRAREGLRAIARLQKFPVGAATGVGPNRDR